MCFKHALLGNIVHTSGEQAGVIHLPGVRELTGGKVTGFTEATACLLHYQSVLSRMSHDFLYLSRCKTGRVLNHT